MSRRAAPIHARREERLDVARTALKQWRHRLSLAVRTPGSFALSAQARQDKGSKRWRGLAELGPSGPGRAGGEDAIAVAELMGYSRRGKRAGGGRGGMEGNTVEKEEKKKGGKRNGVNKSRVCNVAPDSLNGSAPLRPECGREGG